MPAHHKKVLIFDEARFSRICGAILELEGHQIVTASTLEEVCERLHSEDVGLIIASYPFGASRLGEAKAEAIPTIVLSDHISCELISVLSYFICSSCMLKPLDYGKFTGLVRQMMDSSSSLQERGYQIV